MLLAWMIEPRGKRGEVGSHRRLQTLEDEAEVVEESESILVGQSGRVGDSVGEAGEEIAQLNRFPHCQLEETHAQVKGARNGFEEIFVTCGIGHRIREAVLE